MDNIAYFAEALATLRDERRYRVFADLERHAGHVPHAKWHSPCGARDVAMNGTFIATVIIIPFMQQGWEMAAGGLPAMIGDVVLLAVSLYLLRQHVIRLTRQYGGTPPMAMRRRRASRSPAIARSKMPNWCGGELPGNVCACGLVIPV